MTRVTLGKSRVREIRPPGSVRAKPNGIATRPRSRSSSMDKPITDKATAGNVGPEHRLLINIVITDLDLQWELLRWLYYWLSCPYLPVAAVGK